MGELWDVEAPTVEEVGDLEDLEDIGVGSLLLNDIGYHRSFHGAPDPELGSEAQGLYGHSWFHQKRCHQKM